ncbi:3-alpha,7-alpha,12-alpha-trihydroxy-5-beta-cholest-24-enoyl-CoA hydratase [Streptomyces cinnamoneus]|uniref:3-alpha,7-alpha, 12-alpha-trihydroxy-5-beta-cholest-24-enoyl-CoA hydratase n=1 Tax=Streptomyces cinnamoneus TaxID=53446 RepID=A0A2G1XG87_STRCJ|nr:MaoC/PaaZ C-terminal domain-containing protein [Streptomyces cinnamoneus]PHQ50246.1 3-alpha,7-alpha,12-alpha-trihydroxy-5-beta-cholest-24-enoyl-CoA hydratase [Streptomyces cinnamoneus]PPT12969.1 3-alpha,7-alpha,12-alpha-trihydroxy-5-beta-cholest-24-enoyl-CoA hydratase [Streptomyces cinnamoneus]
MPIDPAKATAAEPRTVPLSWDHKDVLLYHLGIGAGSRQGAPGAATDPRELRYTLESRLHVLPSFATVAGGGMALAGGLTAPGVDVDLAAVLHGGQSVVLHRPIPLRSAAGTRQTSRVEAVFDKGKAALIVLRADVADDDGPLWTCGSEIFVKGEGGFGGERGSTGRLEAPARAADLTAERHVREDQALLYRLSGDWNPLHADPEFAALAGYDKPILHGLCSYGIALKAVVDTVLGGEVARVRSYRTRFAGVVFPGETLRVRMWRDAPRPGSVQLTATAVEREDAPVLTDTVVEHD